MLRKIIYEDDSLKASCFSGYLPKTFNSEMVKLIIKSKPVTTLATPIPIIPAKTAT